MSISLALLAPGRVSAHANYKSSTPAKGEVLSASPLQVTITFTQDVQKIAGTYDIAVAPEPVTASGPERGDSVTAGPAVLDDDDRSMMSVPLQPDLAAGRYVVRWKNVSDADGDAAEGAFAFYVGVQPKTADLQADAVFEPGAEETPTPTSGAATPGATPPNSNGDGDGGGSGMAVVIAIVAIVVGGAGGFFGVRWLASRRAR